MWLFVDLLKWDRMNIDCFKFGVFHEKTFLEAAKMINKCILNQIKT